MENEISFSESDKALMVEKLQRYFSAELDRELGRFDAEFLLDFIAKEIGVFFYNQGLYDARAILEKQVENLSEAIYQLEKPLVLK